MNFVIYADNGGHYHWRLDGADRKTLAVSGPTYASAAAARQAAADIHDQAGSATGADR
jgi:uncharacterized protein YegP (UPF0339 family)